MKIVLPSFYEISTLLCATILQSVVPRSGKYRMLFSERPYTFHAITAHFAQNYRLISF